MSIWSRLSTELRTAGRAAQGAIDEGRVRLELFRVGQQCDKAAQALGYAVHRARREGRDLEAPLMERLDGELTAREAELKRLEAELAASLGGTPGTPDAATTGTPPESSPHRPNDQPLQ